MFAFRGDFMERFHGPGGAAAAGAYVDELVAFLPVDPSTGRPEPTDPIQRGLAGLWHRTVPTMSVRWRERFAAATRNLFGEALWDLGHIAGRTVPSPIDYVEVRRTLGRAPWLATLIEYAAGAEIPARLAGNRPVRMLRDAFADAMYLGEDIFSYRSGADSADGINNAVAVVQRFFNYSPQRALTLVHELRVARLRRFEDTAAELPLLVEDPSVDAAARATLAKYAKGLRDWLSGRYTDPGPAPVWRLLTALRRTEATLYRPEFHMPYASRCNRHLDATRTHAADWAAAMGMFDGSVWTRSWFEAMDVALFVALTHPDAPAAELAVVTDWYIWGFYVDDLFVATFERTRDLAGVQAFVARLPAFLRSDPAAVPAPANPAERALADLWIRTGPRLPDDLRRELPGQITEFAGQRLWEIANVIQDRAPDPLEYLESRRKITAFVPKLVRFALGGELPPEVLDSAPMRALIDAFSEIGPLRNDIFSYDKETGREDGINNGVLVVQRFLNCTLDEAVMVVNDLTTSRLRRFERAASTELPALFDELRLDAGTRQVVVRYVEALQDWLAGDLQWSRVTDRYRATVPVPVGAPR